MTAFAVTHLARQLGGAHLLSCVQVTLQSGRVVALLGGNGCGKSTLLDMMTRHNEPDRCVCAHAPTITLDGQDVMHWNAQRLARAGVARTFQRGGLFRDLSVLDNLALAFAPRTFWKSLLMPVRAARALAEQRAQKYLAAAHLLEHLDTPTKHLSVGQARMVELIRTILLPHSVLLLDEPTAGLDEQTKEMAISMILERKLQGDAILLIEHDLDIVRAVADDIFLLKNGRLESLG